MGGTPPRPNKDGTLDLPFPVRLAPTFQQMAWEFVPTPSGEITCLLRIQWANVTGVFELKKAEGMQFADALREGFSGLTIARDVPVPPNGAATPIRPVKFPPK